MDVEVFDGIVFELFLFDGGDGWNDWEGFWFRRGNGSEAEEESVGRLLGFLAAILCSDSALLLAVKKIKERKKA